jgi:hypothetical protein
VGGRWPTGWAGLAVLLLAVWAGGCGSGSLKIGAPRTTTTTAPPTTRISTTTPSITTEATTGTSSSAAALQAVDWKNVTVPAAVCPHAVQTVQLSDGQATIPTPAGLDAGTPQVVIMEGRVVYGDLYGDNQDVAAVYVWCTNTGGAADGQLQSSWVLYSGAIGRPAVVATLTPQQPSDAGDHVAYFDTTPGDIDIAVGKITTAEAWYGDSDPTCCPTGRATTVWTLVHGSLSPSTTIQTYPSTSTP